MTLQSSEFIGDVENFLKRPLDPFETPEQTLSFEAELADFFSVKEAVVVSSGTAAIHCALSALEIGPDSEILVPALSVVMSVVPVLYQNARPIFVDMEPGRVDFNYEDLEHKVSPKVRAILPVYMWGCSYNMPRLISFAQKHGIAVIEDACQAHGTRWNGKYLGTWGDVGCFSMKDGKLISTGEGGFLLTNNINLAKRCRALRSHYINALSPELSYNKLGWNYRLTELQALLGRRQLNRFYEMLQYRQWQTEYIIRGIEDFSQFESYKYSNEEKPNYFSPVLLLREQFVNRKVAEKLSQRGVKNSVGTFGLRPVQEWPVFREMKKMGQHIKMENKTILPITPNVSRFLDRVVALTLLPNDSEVELDSKIETIKTVLAEITK